MRTLLLLSIAAGAVILTDESHAAQDRAAEAAAAAQEAVDAARAKSAEPAKAPVAVTTIAPVAPHAEHGVTYATETRVVTSAPVISPPHSPVVTTVAADYRGDAGVADHGEWICTQDAPDAREYRCRFDGDAPAAGAGWHSSDRHWQQGYAHHGYGHGWYTPAVIVTTTTTPAPVITETVTTETFYETVPVRHRHAHKKRHHKPKSKPRCVC